MILHQIAINFLLFIIGFLGVILNQSSVLMMLLGIEVMLLSCNLNFIACSLYLNDAYGDVFSVFILTVAASESAVGLAILIIVYKIKGTIELAASSRG
jgi:NADH-quinone oxidoreductase subunit K